MVLRDIWGASYREVEAVARWMLEALIESALRDTGGAPGAGRPPHPKKKASPSRSPR